MIVSNIKKQKINLSNNKKPWLANFYGFNLKEFLSLVLAFGLIIFLHSYNMFQFPYYENDEGIYMSQAWALLNKNELSNYTYFYDHAPLGWIILAGIFKILGGVFAFNFSGFAALDTGRIVMLILKLITTLFTYLIIKKQTGKYYLAILGIILMSISPLALYYQRRILLDNIMICLTVISLYFVSKKRITITDSIISSIFLGIAVLTKESAIFFVPGFVLLNYLRLARNQRNLGTFLNLGFFCTIVFLYPITAFLKTELFPSPKKVSLVNTLLYQVGRGTKLPFWYLQSDFMVNFKFWITKDYGFVFGYIISFLLTALTALFAGSRYLIGLIVAIAGMVFFVLRGGVVLDFYLIPFIPLGAIAFMIMINLILVNINKLFKIKIKNSILLLLVFSMVFTLTMFSYGSKTGNDILFKHENTTLAGSLNYAKESISPDAQILVDSSHWLDLRGEDNNKFQNADYYYKADYDSDIKYKKLDNNWKNVDYVIASHQQYQAIKDKIIPLVKKTLDNSFVIADFQPKDDYVVKHDSRYLSVNGNWSTVFKTNNDPSLLKRMNDTYNSKFVSSDGRVIDDIDNVTTSSGQGFSLLRSAITKDKVMYDKVLKWTIDNLQKRPDDKLFSSKFGIVDGQTKIINQETATDGDLDIAYSLILAHKAWNDVYYLDLAKQIIYDIYKNRVVEHNGLKFLIPFSSRAKDGFEILNPSYFSPMYYREFSKIDITNNWDQLVGDTYNIFDAISQNRAMFPDWIKYNIKTQQYESASGDIGKTESDNFGFDAMRIMMRIGQDHQKTGDQRDLKILQNASTIFDNILYDSTIKSTLNRDGNAIINYETSAMNAMATIALRTANATNYGKLWKDSIINKTNYKTGMFNNNEYYYDQNLIWMSYAHDFEIFK